RAVLVARAGGAAQPVLVGVAEALREALAVDAAVEVALGAVRPERGAVHAVAGVARVEAAIALIREGAHASGRARDAPLVIARRRALALPRAEVARGAARDGQRRGIAGGVRRERALAEAVRVGRAAA